MNRETLLDLVSEASLAPSVHNVQPARWRVADTELILFEDVKRRLPACDPEGNDAAMSLGAAVEGVSLAASKLGMTASCDQEALPEGSSLLRPVLRVRFEPGAPTDPLAEFVGKRQSWRGAFVSADPADRKALQSLGDEDCFLFSEASELGWLAGLVDEASYGFMQDMQFRSEILSWMRLSRRHRQWSVDGLNAQAMNLGAIEAAAAGLVLGPAFALLDRLSLADKLLAEAAKTKSAAGVLLFHRPQDEAPFDSGRAFYRLWLRVEARDFGAAVLAALADSPKAATELAQKSGLSPDRKVVSAFRVGKRPPGAHYPRARRSLEELLV